MFFIQSHRDKLLIYFTETSFTDAIKKRNWAIQVSCIEYNTEAVTRRCSVKTVFLRVSEISQENACARVYFLMKL